MKQGEARRIAKAIQCNTDLTVIVDRVRETETGGLIRGGWTHKNQFWAVFLHDTNDILFPVHLRNRSVVDAPFAEKLRRTEAEIAGRLRRCPQEYESEYGVTAEEWERIRQWPGELIEPEEGE